MARQQRSMASSVSLRIRIREITVARYQAAITLMSAPSVLVNKALVAARLEIGGVTPASLKGLIEVNGVQEMHLALMGSQVFGILMGFIPS